MKICTAALASLTYAMKAERILGAEGIPVRVVKLDPSLTRKGCAYGIEFPCERYRTVRTALSSSKIPVSTYLDRAGGTLL